MTLKGGMTAYQFALVTFRIIAIVWFVKSLPILYPMFTSIGQGDFFLIGIGLLSIVLPIVAYRFSPLLARTVTRDIA